MKAGGMIVTERENSGFRTKMVSHDNSPQQIFSRKPKIRRGRYSKKEVESRVTDVYGDPKRDILLRD